MNSELIAPAVAATAASATFAATDPAVSVVVSTFRRAHLLPQLFGHLEAQNLPRDAFEVIVADNASDDGTWACLQHWVAATSLAACAVRVAENSGPSSGRNAAIAAARAEFVVFTDDDCLPAPDWLRAMHTAVRDGHAIVQGRTEPAGATEGPWDRVIDIRGVTHLFEMCNVAFRRDDLLRVGGLRPLTRYRGGRDGLPFGGEDTLLGWSVVRATGADVRFAADARVSHPVERRTFRGWLSGRPRMAIFPALVADVPELRRYFFLRWFFSRRSALFDLCGLGVFGAVALRSWIPLLAALPYAKEVAPRGFRGARGEVTKSARGVVGDAASAWHLARGSWHARRVLL